MNAPRAAAGAGPRIRIAHVLLSLEPGGLENGVVNVINRLDPARFESMVVCLKHAGEFARRIQDPSVQIHEMRWQGGNDPWLPFRLARLFRRIRPDVVHTRNAEPYFYGFAGARLARVPAIVHSEHGRTFDDRPARFAVQRFLTGRTSAVFAVSGQLKADLVRHVGLPAGAVEVLHNGVDLARFDGPAEGGTACVDGLRRAWNIPPGALVIGSVGRLVPVKNYALLLRAVAANGGDAVVVIVGEGAERAALESTARALGIDHRVRLLGHRDDVARLLPAFDVFVLPSTSEGMSNTLLEAMAAGVPPVTSDVGGNPEIVRHGVDGLIFPNGDEAALATHLRALAADSMARRALGTAARARVHEAFDIRAMIKRYERLYERVLARA